MSMSTHIVGFRPPNEKWKQMKAVYDACVKAEIDAPSEVRKFFNDEPPDPEGVVGPVNSNHFVPQSREYYRHYHQLALYLESTKCCAAYDDDAGRVGFELDLAKLPTGITILRFYNSH